MSDGEPIGLRGRTVKIETSGHARGRVWIDGVEVHRVRKIDFHCSVGKLNRVTLELIPEIVEVSGPAEVHQTFLDLSAWEGEGGATAPEEP